MESKKRMERTEKKERDKGEKGDKIRYTMFYFFPYVVYISAALRYVRFCFCFVTNIYVSSVCFPKTHVFPSVPVIGPRPSVLRPSSVLN